MMPIIKLDLPTQKLPIATCVEPARSTRVADPHRPYSPKTH